MRRHISNHTHQRARQGDPRARRTYLNRVRQLVCHAAVETVQGRVFRAQDIAVCVHVMLKIPQRLAESDAFFRNGAVVRAFEQGGSNRVGRLIRARSFQAARWLQFGRGNRSPNLFIQVFRWLGKAG